MQVLIPADTEIRPRTVVEHPSERQLDGRLPAELDTLRTALDREQKRADAAEKRADAADQDRRQADADRRAAEARAERNEHRAEQAEARADAAEQAVTAERIRADQAEAARDAERSRADKLENELQAIKIVPTEAPAPEEIEDGARPDTDEPTRVEQPQFQRQPLRWLVWAALGRLEDGGPRSATTVEDLHFQHRSVRWLARGILYLRTIQRWAVPAAVITMPFLVGAVWIVGTRWNLPVWIGFVALLVPVSVTGAWTGAALGSRPMVRILLYGALFGAIEAAALLGSTYLGWIPATDTSETAHPLKFLFLLIIVNCELFWFAGLISGSLSDILTFSETAWREAAARRRRNKERILALLRRRPRMAPFALALARLAQGAQLVWTALRAFSRVSEQHNWPVVVFVLMLMITIPIFTAIATAELISVLIPGKH